MNNYIARTYLWNSELQIFLNNRIVKCTLLNSDKPKIRIDCTLMLIKYKQNHSFKETYLLIMTENNIKSKLNNGDLDTFEFDNKEFKDILHSSIYNPFQKL